MQTLAKALMRRVDVEVKHQIVFWAAHFDAARGASSKAIMHLEAFVRSIHGVVQVTSHQGVWIASIV